MKSITTEVFQLCSSSKSNRLNVTSTAERYFGSCLAGWFGWRLHPPRTGGCRIWGETPSRVCCTCQYRCAKIQGEVLVSSIFGRLALILHWEKSTPKMWLVQVQAVFHWGFLLVMSKKGKSRLLNLRQECHHRATLDDLHRRCGWMMKKVATWFEDPRAVTW